MTKRSQHHDRGSVLGNKKLKKSYCKLKLKSGALLSVFVAFFNLTACSHLLFACVTVQLCCCTRKCTMKSIPHIFFLYVTNEHDICISPHPPKPFSQHCICTVCCMDSLRIYTFGSLHSQSVLFPPTQSTTCSPAAGMSKEGKKNKKQKSKCLLGLDRVCFLSCSSLSPTCVT